MNGDSRRRRSVYEKGVGIIRGRFVLVSRDRRFTRLFREATLRLPQGVSPIKTVKLVSLSNRRTKTMVGLTKYSRVRFFFLSRPKQSITFYSSLMGALSEQAATAVIAHELAHAWLNEHVRPEESRRREGEADLLAREWGFGAELDALNREAETVNSP